MSKIRPQNTGLRGTRSGKHVNEEGPDVCELLVAELQARRARLRELLSLVLQEAARTSSGPVKRVQGRTHSPRRPMAMKRIA